MRVLFTTTPGLGHLHPMTPLARAFMERGDEVVWATAGPACARLEREGYRAVAAGLDEAEGMSELARRFPELQSLAPADRPTFMFPRLFGDVRAGPMLAALLDVTRDYQPSLLVCDAADLAGPIAAAALGVPNVTHSFGALLPPERVAAGGSHVAPLWEEQGLAPRPFGGCYDHLYLDIYPASLQAGDRSHVGPVQAVRPVTFAAPGDEDVPGLVTGPVTSPLVYVTFGTVFNQDLSLMATVLQALRDLPLRIVATLGPKGEPSALGPQPGNVHVARYIPQTELLEHCTTVVSHAGSGTFLAALARGLPQLCLPQAADQFLNAAACDRSGTGLSLLPGTVTADAVRASVERLLAESHFRTGAEGLSREIAAMPAPEAVVEAIHQRFS